jgi:RNA polymerase sigma-70 factor (ECF subfamily)
MVAYAKGDSSALGVLYDRFSDPLYRFFLHCVSNVDLAEDLVQDIFVSLARSRDRYQPTAAFRHYIFHMARNRVITHWRRERPTSSLDEIENLVPDRGSTPAEAVESADLSRALRNAISRLPQNQAHVILLRWEGDLTMQEIAKVQEVGVEAVKSRYRMAIAKLREALAHA